MTHNIRQGSFVKTDLTWFYVNLEHTSEITLAYTRRQRGNTVDKQPVNFIEQYENRCPENFRAQYHRPTQAELDDMNMNDFFTNYKQENNKYICKQDQTKFNEVLVFLPNLKGHDKSSKLYPRYC